MSSKMKFELLPNEILMECFYYLNAPDIFYAFDRLNYRFYTLIRDIPLHLNFQKFKKSTFNKFCQIILSNPKIKQNMTYLKLSNKGTRGQIQSFLSLFPLNEFIHLKSLSLIDMDQNNIEQVSLTLALLPDLYCFVGTGQMTEAEKIIPAVSKSNIRVLTFPTYGSTSVDHISLLTSLTVNFHFMPYLASLLYFTLVLKYLKIDNLYDHDARCGIIKGYESELSKIKAVHLQQLIINYYCYAFANIELLLKCFPNLKIFSFFAQSAIYMMDGNRWQHLIESSLPLLRVFNFRLHDHHFNSYDKMLTMLSPFQTDFWYKRDWYVNYVYNDRFTSIYTIPYPYSYYYLQGNAQKFNSLSMNDLNEFDNVKKLSLCTSAIRNKSSWYFRNVQSLSLTSTYGDNDKKDKYKLKIEQIEYLKKMVNLSNITKLEITEECLITPALTFEILSQMSNISSLKISRSKLIYKNDQLSDLLSKKIKILDFSYHAYQTYNKIKDLDWFCKTFSNLEELICDMVDVNDLSIILTKCSKLSIIKIEEMSKEVYAWIQNNASTSNIYFNYKRTY